MSLLSDNKVFRPLFWPTLFLLLALPVLLWLGTWQVQRLDWKLGLIERMESRLDAPAIDMAETAPGPDDEYRRYRVTGTFDPDREFHWLATSDEYGIGYLVFSPFKLEDGRRVIVNRGFVPAPLKDAEKGRHAGKVTFEAIARLPEEPGMLDAENDLDANIWFTRDTRRMAELSGGDGYLPVYLERVGGVPEKVWPKPGAAQVALVNNHLDYALTWFGLALVLTVIYLAFHKAQGRIGRI